MKGDRIDDDFLKYVMGMSWRFGNQAIIIVDKRKL